MKSSRLSRLVFALLVSGVAVGLPPALAAELPADTNTIESLTPEQATTLNSAALVTKLTQRNDALLWISRLTAVSPEAAEVLAGIDKWDGRLPSLTTLDSPDSVEIAKALATRKQRLSLPNLEKISPKTLSALLEKRDVEIPIRAPADPSRRASETNRDHSHNPADGHPSDRQGATTMMPSFRPANAWCTVGSMS